MEAKRAQAHAEVVDAGVRGAARAIAALKVEMGGAVEHPQVAMAAEQAMAAVVAIQVQRGPAACRNTNTPVLSGTGVCFPDDDGR
jgi:hypothetical protein